MFMEEIKFCTNNIYLNFLTLHLGRMGEIYVLQDSNIHTMEVLVTKSTWFNNNETPSIIFHNIIKMLNGFKPKNLVRSVFHFFPI